ncbi:hypothetical protein M3Y95_00654300 [Aphelenchoides besseyi]|nr:hypothetical protein M3Y95_00654300 [Aphelenchoides besseyi]
MKVDVESETSSLESFEPWDPKFRCCCQAVHVKQGTLIIGIVTGVLIFYSIITIPIALGGTTLWNIAQILLLLVDFITIIFLLRAIRTENHHFLLPYLIYSAHTILLLICGISFGLYNFFRPLTDEGWFLLDVLFEHERDSQRPVEYDERAIKVAGMFTAVSCSFALILSAWFLKVVWKCYLYFKACTRSRRFLDEHEERRYLPIEFE